MDRFITPSVSSITRRFQILSASDRAWTSPSSWVTPTSAHSPAPIRPTTSPSTVTAASPTPPPPRAPTARPGGCPGGPAVLEGASGAPRLVLLPEHGGVLSSFALGD